MHGEELLRNALDLFARGMRYPKGTADTLRSLAQNYSSTGHTGDLARALEFSVASVLIYPYRGNQGTKITLALLRNLRTAMGEAEFLRQLRNAEERWKSKEGPFTFLGRFVLERRAVAAEFLKALKSHPPLLWEDSLL